LCRAGGRGINVIEPNITLDHTAVSGFTESIGERTGTRDLWVALRLAFCGDPHHCVRRHPWDDRAHVIARRIALDAARDVRGRAVGVRSISAYSWGAPTAIDICHSLADAWGMRVDLLTLIDPVPRRWLNRRRFWRNWSSRALGSSPSRRVEIPENVAEVWVYRQCNKQGLTDPIGAAPRLLGSDTLLGRHVLLGHADRVERYRTGTETDVVPDATVRHSGAFAIDERPAIRQSVVAALREQVMQFRSESPSPSPPGESRHG
jgi:hypothetical protein